MLKKVMKFAAVTAVVAMVSAMTVSAAPYKDFQIGAGETVIECEDFDSEDVGENNASDGDHTYRPEEGTQTGTGGREDGQYNVGWTAGGEWLQYTVNVTQVGNYNFAVWMGGDNSAGHSIELSVDGNSVGAEVIPNIGWTAYELVNIGDMDLTEGSHVIRIDIPNGAVNLDAIAVTQLSASESAAADAGAEESADAGAEESEAKDIPATGDLTNLAAPISMLAVGLGAAIIMRKKQNA